LPMSFLETMPWKKMTTNSGCVKMGFGYTIWTGFICNW
jgi:hypothetical protein